MHYATLFLSTGRCGTQWLASALSQLYGERARVEHEPLEDRYRWRELLGGAAPSEALLDHLDTIERTLESRDYIETGYPCWSALPLLMERLGARLRIIHLTRHPVDTALSWVSNGAYAEPLLPRIPGGRVLLAPEDAGVMYPHYATLWGEMSRYEKCLWYWAELHGFAERFTTRSTGPWLHLYFESLFTGDGAARLAGFLGDIHPQELERHRARREDAHRFLIGEWSDPALIERHPEVLATARRLGYDPLAFDTEALRARHRPF